MDLEEDRHVVPANATDALIPDDLTLTTAGEVESRRSHVLMLRRRKLSMRKIADSLGVALGTICRDIQWLRENATRMYGPDPMFDRAVFIGETMDVYREVEIAALKDMTSPSASIRDRNYSRHVLRELAVRWAEQERVGLIGARL